MTLTYATDESMTFNEAIEMLETVLSAMEGFIALAHREPETLEDEMCQQPVNLLKLFLRPLKAAYLALLEAEAA